MTYLNNLKKIFSKSTIISNQEALNIKGGRRKFFYSEKRALRKMERLRLKGKTPMLRKDGDVYCIDW